MLEDQGQNACVPCQTTVSCFAAMMCSGVDDVACVMVGSADAACGDPVLKRAGAWACPLVGSDSVEDTQGGVHDELLYEERDCAESVTVEGDQHFAGAPTMRRLLKVQRASPRQADVACEDRAAS